MMRPSRRQPGIDRAVFGGWWRTTRAMLSNGDHRRLWRRLDAITIDEAQTWTRKLEDENPEEVKEP